MTNTDAIPKREELEAHLEYLEVISGDCAKLLANFRAGQPEGNPRSPDAIIAILGLQQDMRRQIRTVLNLLGEEQLPF